MIGKERSCAVHSLLKQRKCFDKDPLVSTQCEVFFQGMSR